MDALHRYWMSVPNSTQKMFTLWKRNLFLLFFGGGWGGMKLKKMVLITDVNYNWLDIQYIQIPPPVGHRTHVEQTNTTAMDHQVHSIHMKMLTPEKAGTQRQRIKRVERRERDRQVYGTKTGRDQQCLARRDKHFSFHQFGKNHPGTNTFEAKPDT